MKKVLLIGPLPEPTTGVSLANKVVFDSFENLNDFKIEVINTAYQRFEEKHGSFSLKKVLFFLKVNLFAYKLFRNDIIYLTPGQTFYGVLKYFIFILFSKLFNKELIIHVHGNFLGKQYELLSGLKKIIFFSILKLTDKGIVLSELLIDNMTPFIPKNRVYILYNFVEDYIINIMPNIKSKRDIVKPRIFFLSNLMEEKGIFDFLEALKILEERGVLFEAKIAGNIDNLLENKIQDYLKSIDSVEYCGIVRGKKKQDLLCWGNIFVLPTYYSMEGQPIAILEAMATGNVILTTNHSGIPDIFKEGRNGYFIDKNSPLSIVNKILAINNNIVERNIISSNNIKEAREKYKVNNFIENIKGIFEA